MAFLKTEFRAGLIIASGQYADGLCQMEYPLAAGLRTSFQNGSVHR